MTAAFTATGIAFEVSAFDVSSFDALITEGIDHLAADHDYLHRQLCALRTDALLMAKQEQLPYPARSAFPVADKRTIQKSQGSFRRIRHLPRSSC